MLENQDYSKVNYIYLEKDNKILKLKIEVDEFSIKEGFLNLERELKSSDFRYVLKETLDDIKFPISSLHFLDPSPHFSKFMPFKIPDSFSEKCKLIYILTDIYNEKTLTSNSIYTLYNEHEYLLHLNDINSFTQISIQTIENIVNNLNIEIIDEYSYDKLSEILDYLENVSISENIDTIINLEELKEIIFSSSSNKIVFENLGIQVLNKSKRVGV